MLEASEASREPNCENTIGVEGAGSSEESSKLSVAYGISMSASVERGVVVATLFAAELIVFTKRREGWSSRG